MSDASYDINSCQKDFCKAMVNQHNKYRQLHQVNDLEIDDDISKVSQKYALKLAKSDNGLKHSNGKYGENLAYQMDSRFKLNQKTCTGLNR